MGTRELKRYSAKKLYERFSKLWRDDLRKQGLYGKPRSPKRPKFHEWYEMHAHNLDDLRESTPADVREHLEINAADPWAEDEKPVAVEVPSRGVETINIAGNEED